MTIRIKSGLLAACAFATSFFTSTAAFAAEVGYHGTCYGENPAVAIGAAGHTPVAVASLSSASLSGLAALVIGSCDWPTNAELDAAIAGGLTVIAHDPSYYNAGFPPGLDLARTDVNGYAIEFAADAPFLDGPGGVIDNTSLDGGSASNHGYLSGTLPAGGRVLATTETASQIVTITYPYGAGRIVYSTIPLGCYLPGGGCTSIGVAPAMQRYAANIISAYAGPGFTTCAAEGYKGAKLTLCRKICESNITGSTLNGLIRTYVAAYREQPACVR